MLQITIPAREAWDEGKEEFVRTKEQKLQLEHSLVSLSKWEANWCKPFFTKEKKTLAETIDYVKCMTLTQNVNPEVYNYLTNENMNQINKYIEAPMTATRVSNLENKGSRGEQVTNELIYYWMFTLGIPKECEKWHINRLLTQIKVFNVKNQPPKKRSKREIMSRNAALNAQRRQRLNTRG